MLGFKRQLEHDLEAVFHNADEHADLLRVEYNGETCNIPVIIDHEGARDRERPSSDHADGIFAVDLTVYISLHDLGIVPRKDSTITIDHTDYNIARVGCDAGEITLDLEMMDE